MQGPLYIQILLCLLIYKTETQVIHFPSAKASKENVPCSINQGRFKGICLPTRKCPNFENLLEQHGSFLNIACPPASSTLVCCIHNNNSKPTSAAVFDVSEPASSPKGCGTYVESFVPDYKTINSEIEEKIAPGLPSTNPLFPDPIMSSNAAPPLPEPTTYEDYPFIFNSPEYNTGAAVGGADSRLVLSRYMAIIGETTSDGHDWFCDGALINWEWILTAAHCFKRVPNVVRLGEYDLREDSVPPLFIQDYGIKKIVLYPEYSFPSTNHDLALIQLNGTASFGWDEINPICLPWGRRATDTHIGRQVTLTGWGATQFGKPITDVLQEVNITVFDSEVCDRGYSVLRDYKRRFPDGIKAETHLCAGDVNGGKDACQGDSGGPIAYEDQGRFYLAGIVSTGHGCGLKEFPGIYAPINTPKYLSWIKKIAFSD